MSEMMRMFEAIYDLAKRQGTLEEALLYKDSKFAKVEYEKNGFTYCVTITKEEKRDA